MPQRRVQMEGVRAVDDVVPDELAGCAEIVEGVVMDKERKAIERLRLAAQMSETYYEQPLIITTSRGKDSDVCRKCDLYDHEKQDCGMRSVDSGTPVCECMSRKRYEYLTRED